MNGKMVKTDHPDTGDLLLYSLEEWKERREAQAWRFHKHLWFILLIAMLAMWYGGGSFLEGGVPGPIWLVMGVVFYLFISGMTSAEELWYHWRDKKLGFVTGLFDNGLLIRGLGFSDRFFIPYDQIEAVIDRPVLGAETLSFKIRDRKWRFRAFFLPSFLGPEGMALLVKKVAGIPEPTGPPKLVIYGDAKLKMASRDPDE